MYGYENVTHNSNLKSQNFDILKIGLSAPRSILNKRIDDRVDSRLDQGMIEEAQKLHQAGLSLKRMNELGLEYRMLAAYLAGALDIKQFTTKLKNKIHQYAKRQMTWFKRDEEIKWFDITDKNFAQKVASQVLDWYNA
jgi:tRNA dimethylallyltransferase